MTVKYKIHNITFVRTIENSNDELDAVEKDIKNNLEIIGISNSEIKKEKTMLLELTPKELALIPYIFGSVVENHKCNSGDKCLLKSAGKQVFDKSFALLKSDPNIMVDILLELENLK